MKLTSRRLYKVFSSKSLELAAYVAAMGGATLVSLSVIYMFCKYKEAQERKRAKSTYLARLNITLTNLGIARRRLNEAQSSGSFTDQGETMVEHRREELAYCVFRLETVLGMYPLAFDPDERQPVVVSEARAIHQLYTQAPDLE